MEKILFTNHGISPGIENKEALKAFLVSVFNKEQTQFERVSYIFCKDQYLLALNQKYLNHNTLTDILTFTLSGLSLPIISEIYISVERVKENAATLKTLYQTELTRVMVHGILHLCGYADNTPQKKSLMGKKEDVHLSQLDSYLSRFT